LGAADLGHGPVIMTNPWAPKSIHDDADEPIVARARRWHAPLYALLFALGMAVGYVVFEVMDTAVAAARFMWLYGGDDQTGADLFLARGVLMVFAGAVFGELGNALWLVMCRYRLLLSAAEARAAWRSPSIPSFVLARLHDRLYEGDPR
jgi:hypothetical protein